MEIEVQLLDDTILFSYSRDPPIPQPRRHRYNPPPRVRRSNPSRFQRPRAELPPRVRAQREIARGRRGNEGAELPPRLSAQRANAWRHTGNDTVEIPPHLHVQVEDSRNDDVDEDAFAVFESFNNTNVQNRRDGISLSEEFITEYLSWSTTLYCSKDEQYICTICQDEIQKEEQMVALNCGHAYHVSCIHDWLMVKNECAVCRASAIPID